MKFVIGFRLAHTIRLLTEELNPYLENVDRQANDMMMHLIKKRASAYGGSPE